ncbi:MAG: hypothetical protein ACRDJC_24330, partial [Thermomicrobiales bacterium]
RTAFPTLRDGHRPSLVGQRASGLLSPIKSAAMEGGTLRTAASALNGLAEQGAVIAVGDFNAAPNHLVLGIISP